MASDGQRRGGLGGPVQSVQTGPVSLCGQPGNPLGRRRLAGTVLAKKLGRHERDLAESGSSISTDLGANMADDSRRAFIKRAALGTAAILSYPAAQVLGANDRLRVGIIGAGGRGMDLVDDVRKQAVYWFGGIWFVAGYALVSLS